VTLNAQPAPDTRPDCTNSVGFGTSDWWTEGWPDGTNPVLSVTYY
jgi:hypothetical protein